MGVGGGSVEVVVGSSEVVVGSSVVVEVEGDDEVVGGEDEVVGGDDEVVGVGDAVVDDSDGVTDVESVEEAEAEEDSVEVDGGCVQAPSCRRWFPDPPHACHRSSCMFFSFQTRRIRVGGFVEAPSTC